VYKVDKCIRVVYTAEVQNDRNVEAAQVVGLGFYDRRDEDREYSHNDRGGGVFCRLQLLRVDLAVVPEYMSGTKLKKFCAYVAVLTPIPAISGLAGIEHDVPDKVVNGAEKDRAPSLKGR
jgi:hypothetical protein